MAKKKKASQKEDRISEITDASHVPTNEIDGTVTDKRENEVEGDSQEDAVELLQVDTGDVIKVKQVLDEAVAGALIDGEPKLLENYTLENIKLALMTAACLFAVIAQFAPLPFPESRMAMGGCCLAYFVLSGILQLLVSFVERDAIMVTRPPKEGDYKMKGKGLRVRASLPRYEEFYTILIEYDGIRDSPFVKQTWSVGKFFDVEGMFDEMFLIEEIEKLVKRFEKGQYDKEESSENRNKKKTH